MHRSSWLTGSCVLLSAACGALGGRAPRVDPPQGVERPAGSEVEALAAPLVDRVPAIDGRMREGEWAGAAETVVSEGLRVRSMTDGEFLFLAFVPRGQGIGTVALQFGDDVHVLHASMSVGAGVYRRDGAAWSRKADFEWERPACTPGATSDPLKAYLEEHGWAASMISCAEGGVLEFAIALDYAERHAGEHAGERDPGSGALIERVALGFIAMDGSGPQTLPSGLTDELSSRTLHMGQLAAKAAFDTDDWLTWPEAAHDEAHEPESKQGK